MKNTIMTKPRQAIIDIHSHVIHCVDDGSKSVEASLAMISQESSAGVTDIICTPHYRKGFFETEKQVILSRFDELKKASENLGVSLHLGQEIAVKNVFAEDVAKGKCFTMANSDYVLLEFDYNNPVDITDVCYDYKYCGLIPIIAHVERYNYVGVREVEDIIEVGGLIQINSSSVVAKKFSKYRSKVDKYLKHNLVHFVASDNHSNRSFDLASAYEAIRKKYGEERARDLFESNARKILNSSK